MNPHHIAALVNLLGFITGAALYAMLLVMVVRAVEPNVGAVSSQRARFSTERLLLTTALLGLLWNLGALVIYSARDWDLWQPSRWLEAAVFTALGFLPAVVVHAVLRAGAEQTPWRGAQLLTAAAYALSALASALHFYAAMTGSKTPSPLALRTLTFGFSVLTVLLLLYTRRSSLWKRTLWVVALAVFAVSALHLSEHTSGEASWFVELIGHHASLPLVLAMLYQDYRFALADIFLKRALALVALVALAFGLYVLAAAPLLRLRDANGDLAPLAVGALLGLWLGTAWLYPLLRRGVVWFVDAIVLRRANYQQLRDEWARLAAGSEDPQEILEKICPRLAQALTARAVHWAQHEIDNTAAQARGAGHLQDFLLTNQLVRVTDQERARASEPRLRTGRLRRPAATVWIPTHEPPRYSLVIAELSGGRQLLSDDIAWLESIALMLARRIDAVRVAHERCAHNLREQETSKLATEAELRALRAQLNPHFLFNALTTISYLIQTAPERALETLLRLTGLLRAVLRAPSGELATVGEEMDLIESYLAIEHARFEERLRVVIDVPMELRKLRLPPLVVQPLIENAIKHGIAPGRCGGEVIVSAHVEYNGADGGNKLCIAIHDTGVGVSDSAFAQGRRRGVGLVNVERRLECFYGPAATLHFQSEPGVGTQVELRLPVDIHPEALSEKTAGAQASIVGA